MEIFWALAILSTYYLAYSKGYKKGVDDTYNNLKRVPVRK